MHHIWNIPELLELIFDFLAIHDAAAAATVCRSIWLAALAHIWRDINTFSRLLKLLPQDKLSEIYHSDLVASTPKRRLEEPDWERFLLHSKYTRSLSVPLDPETLRDCLPLLPDLPLTPILHNLSSVTVGISLYQSEPDLKLISLFLPHTVSKVRIYFTGGEADPPDGRIIQMLAKDIKLPDLKSFSISGIDCPSPHVNASIPQVLRSHPGIQSLDIQLVSGSDVMEALNAAGELPGLRHLDSCVIRSAFTIRQAPRLLFPALETINIAGPLPFINAVLDCAGSENMCSVQMLVYGRPQEAEDALLFSRCLGSIERFTRLETLDLELEAPVSLGDFCHILTCRNIEDLRIVADHFLSSDTWGNLFEKMATAWPRLRTLEIMPMWCYPNQGNLLGLSHLQLIATECRALRRFRTAVDVRGENTPTFDLDKGARSVNNAMQELEVTCTLGEDVTEMWLAVILRNMWPGLHVVSSAKTRDLNSHVVTLTVTLKASGR